MAFWKFEDGSVMETTYQHNGWRGAVKIGKAEFKRLEMESARKVLAAFIGPKAEITCVCVKVTRGQLPNHHYRVFVIDSNCYGKPYIRDITHDVAKACGFKVSCDKAIIMGGYGYSKSFQIVYNLGCVLWPNGTPEPHGTRNGEPDSDGGYALVER